MANRIWVKSPLDGFLNFILNEAVFWCTVVVLITATAAIVGYQLKPGSGGAPEPDDQQTTFWTLLWTALLQLLLNYCTVVPVIREQRLDVAGQRWIIQVNHVIFYGSVAVSVVATILAPVLQKYHPESILAARIPSFISNVFSVVAASQLASGITGGGLRDRAGANAQRRRWRFRWWTANRD